jgi:hypothetical protein
LIRRSIIERHDYVMYSKGRLESCWLRPEGGGVAKVQDYAPYFRPSRHRQAVSIMIDLALLQEADEQISITGLGRSVLQQCLGVLS